MADFTFGSPFASMDDFPLGDPSAPSTIATAIYKVGDRVRVKSTKVFGIVAWLKAPPNIELWVLGNDLELVRVPVSENQIEIDAPLNSNAIYVNRKDTAANHKKGSAKVAYAKVLNQRRVGLQPLWTTSKPPKNLPKPAQTFLSEYEYLFDGSSEFVNGCFVSKNPARDIEGSSGEQSFFSMINRHVELIYIPEQLRMKGCCLAYRGDTREPETVFKTGFEVWEDHPTPVFRSISDGTPHYDILPPSGVCASGRPQGGCIFPLIEVGSAKLDDHIYLYAFVAYQPFATCRIQRELLNPSDEPSKIGQHKEFIENLLRAEEIVVGKEGVKGRDVFAACKIHRRWRSDQWVEGAKLSPKEFYFNAAASLQTEVAEEELRHLFNDMVITHCHETPTFTG